MGLSDYHLLGEVGRHYKSIDVPLHAWLSNETSRYDLLISLHLFF